MDALKTHLALVVVALAAGAAALAHNDGTAGSPKLYCEDDPYELGIHDYAPGYYGMAADGSIGPCAYDPDWDGHYEFALGGAWLLADPAASILCAGVPADHPTFPTIWVVDDMLTGTDQDVFFKVAVDSAGPTCGDGLVDFVIPCTNVCVAPFSPGLDGAYHVFVDATRGHVLTTQPPECLDRRDNDNDGSRDHYQGALVGPWGGLTDPGCSSPYDASEA